MGSSWLAAARRDGRWIDGLIAAVFVVVRLVAAIGRPIQHFPDTPGYLRLDVTGHDARLWPVPLVYRLAVDDTARVIVQVLLSCAAWLLLAHAARRLAPRLRWAAPIWVLVLGATPQVARWDQAILSESLGITFAVAAIACWVIAVTTDRGAWWIATATTTVVFGMTRPLQVPLLAGAAVVLVALAARRRSTATIVAASVAMVGAVAGFVMVRNNEGTSSLNLYTVLVDRVVHDEERAEWFVRHGMPWDDDFARAGAYLFPGSLEPSLARALDFPPAQPVPDLIPAGGFELADWVRDEGWTTYARNLASHPWPTITGELRRLDMMLDPADFELLTLHPRLPVPRGVFGRWQLWVGAAVALGSAAIARLGWRRMARPLAVPAAVLTACVPWFYAASLLSGLEHPRHAVTLAVCLRVGALLVIVAAWDRLTVPADGASPPASSTP